MRLSGVAEFIPNGYDNSLAGHEERNMRKGNYYELFI
jgi:hypothetical protein